ncbi:pirin family protein [Mucisphaera sp.]|uniref:pirin family protein n=1 Tax=Mucisphaera sp. TaxID=2913024 RepID=UPI003D11E75F
MITPRPANDRGATHLSWLNSRHTFSFGQYQDPQHMGFGPLRVINDDIVAPAGGFGEHPHKDMEIMTWVLSGALKHGDSLGNLQTLTPGELQVMTAGRGIYHTEMNASNTEPTHFLQIWIQPRTPGVEPRYDQHAYPREGRTNQWQLLAADDTETDRFGPQTLPIAQAARLSVADLDPGQTLTYDFEEGRSGWLHLATGKATADSHQLQAGDALAIQAEPGITITAEEKSQVLLFDLAENA